jgi:N-acylneuraminate cytidylyltransferase
LKKVAFVPLRGGSKSIPLKNIKPLAGHPLCWWSLVSLQNSKDVDQIVVATDSEEIKSVVSSFGFSKLQVYMRDSVNAQDTSSTESVMLEYLKKSGLKSEDFFILVQATNPFILHDDISKAFHQMKSEGAESLLSTVVTKRFFWSHDGKPLNYDFMRRPRRQDFSGYQMENGAFYINSVGKILSSQNRLSGKISVYEMSEHSGFEIDEPDDWTICEQLLKKYRKADILVNLPKIKLFLTDVDGTLTDAGMYYTENGDEIKKFNTRDGMGLKLLRESGIKVGMLTAENRELNRRRAQKLKLDYDFHGVEDKLTLLKKLVSEMGIGLGDVAYIGDDLNDIEILGHVGLAACPADSCLEVKSIPGILVMKTRGGEGAVREFAGMILGSKI